LDQQRQQLPVGAYEDRDRKVNGCDVALPQCPTSGRQGQLRRCEGAQDQPRSFMRAVVRVLAPLLAGLPCNGSPGLGVHGRPCVPVFGCG
jgi:hypothetical protein